LRALEQDEAAIQEERQAWPEAIAGIATERFVFIDESAALTNLVRLYGRSPRGERAPGAVPCGHWDRVTILGALGPEGIVAAMSIPAATDGAVFHAYLEQVLLPELRRTRPDAVLVMDNLAAHKAQAVRTLLDASGFTYLYLPRYSPDLNPIEPAWAKVKGILRKAAARTVDALHAALGPALAAISKDDARGFFHHAGYACPN
jgi:transposase